MVHHFLGVNGPKSHQCDLLLSDTWGLWKSAQLLTGGTSEGHSWHDWSIHVSVAFFPTQSNDLRHSTPQISEEFYCKWPCPSKLSRCRSLRPLPYIAFPLQLDSAEPGKVFFFLTSKLDTTDQKIRDCCSFQFNSACMVWWFILEY